MMFAHQPPMFLIWTRTNVDEIWQGRVRMWQPNNVIFFSPSPPTNLLLWVTNDGVLN